MARVSSLKRGRERGALTRRLSPDDQRDLLRRAMDHQREGAFAEAIDIYEQIEAAHPETVEAAHLHALIEIEQGRLLDALARLRRVIRRAPPSAEALSSLAYVHRELGQAQDAIDVSHKIVAMAPNDASALFGLSQSLEIGGRLDEAVAVLRRAAASTDDPTAALGHLATLKPGSLTPDEDMALRAAARDPGKPPATRIMLNFAVGEVCERRGLYDEAFEAFATGAALKRAMLTSPPDPERERQMAAPGDARRGLHPDIVAHARDELVTWVKLVFTPEFIAQYQGQGSHIPAPIFVIGIPRSGSTLIEQILSSHSQVQGLGETNALDRVIRDKFPHSFFAAHGDGHFQALSADYLAAMHARGWKSSARFIDKQLGNFFHIGIIHLMFPNATILHAVRDPVDNCLAYFRKLFWSANELSYDLRDIGADYIRYREVMDHWAAVMPGRIIPVSHEALVADPDAQIRWLVSEACGLKWEDACLRFYDTKRQVRTASVAQVRQPIFKTSIERWRRYEKHLGPLFDALGPYAPKG